MSVEQNKATMRRITDEAWNKGDYSIVDRHIAPAWAYDGPFGKYGGPQGFKDMVTMFRTAFPDCRFTIDDIMGEGDRLAVRYTITGTMKGNLMGIPPTGKGFRTTAAYFYRFQDGKEVEVIPFGDPQPMFEQLGLRPQE